MCRLKNSFILCIIAVIFSSQATAQNASSPYSIRGVGNVVSPALTHNLGMGGLGLSYGSPLYLNNINPALLAANSFSSFNVGLEGSFNKISNADNSTSNVGGGLNYAILGLPIMPGRWSLSAGLMPYSQVNYKYNTTGKINETNINVDFTYEGEGGISQAFIANGIRLNKNFSVGFRASYFFGSIIKESSTQISDTTVSGAYRPVFFERTSFSDFGISGGLSYIQKIKGKTYLNIGLTYDLETDVNTKNFSRFERRTFQGRSISSDTLLNNVRGSIILPARLGVGFSFVNSFKWLVGADLQYQTWSDYRDFNDDNGNLDDNYKITVGGEYTPDVASLNSYLKRVTYRVGLNYETTPFMVNNQQLNDFGINFGMSLPVSRYSSMDFAFKVGQRGTVDDNLTKEQYFRVFLGVTLNDRWFARRKLD